LLLFTPTIVWCLQNRAVVNLFKGPNMIEDTYTTLQQLERGDLKLRVRALEAERALTRVAVSTLRFSAFLALLRVFCVESAALAAGTAAAWPLAALRALPTQLEAVPCPQFS
jgi:hypothetical protein